ncbi:MAG: YicC/YloC family endoribonuclease, partial [Pseudohongiellaceae bacterium]
LGMEIRSVNSRFLDLSFKVPEELRQHEAAMRELLMKHLKRGKVEVQLKWMASSGATPYLSLNQDLLNQLQKATESIAMRFTNCGPVSPIDILRWPGLIAEAEQDTKLMDEGALELFRATLDALQQQRLREGAQLRALIEERLKQVSSIVDGIRKDLPGILAAQAERIKAQFADLQLEVEPTRLEQEIVLVTQKADIHEEVDRLDTHVKEVLHTLKQGGAIGRRLDFLMQEFNREANTICSKAIVTSTTFGAVELKVLIEQMREQIQNIE